MASKKTFGEIVREFRVTNHLTLREIAAKLEIDISLLSKIENNKRSANRNLVHKFSHLFGIEEKELLVAYLSDKVAYEIAEENFASEVLKIAEAKVLYFKNKKQK